MVCLCSVIYNKHGLFCNGVADLEYCFCSSTCIACLNNNIYFLLRRVLWKTFITSINPAISLLKAFKIKSPCYSLVNSLYGQYPDESKSFTAETAKNNTSRLGNTHPKSKHNINPPQPISSNIHPLTMPSPSNTYSSSKTFVNYRHIPPYQQKDPLYKATILSISISISINEPKHTKSHTTLL